MVIESACMIDRRAILTALDAYIGLPFVHQSRFAVLPDGTRTGGDCLGLLLRVAWDVGVPLEDSPDYEASTNGILLRLECQRQLVEIGVADVRPGDVVQWAEHAGVESPPCNVAWVGWRGGGLTLVHAVREPYNSVVEHGLRPPWPQRIRWAYSLPGVGPWLPVL